MHDTDSDKENMQEHEPVGQEHLEPLFEWLSSTSEYLNLGDVEFSMHLCRDQDIQALNRDYRDEDKATDVLAFTQNSGEHVVPPHIGDIVISIDTAGKQASSKGHSLRFELAFLAIHGLLHLLGYDHATPEEEKEMFTKQDDIIEYLSKSHGLEK